MNRVQIREMLNHPRAQYYTVLGELSKYITTDATAKAKIANSMVESVKKHRKISTALLLNFFAEAARDIVHNTNFCRDRNAENTLLKTIYERSQFQNIVVALVRKNYAKLPMPEEAKPKVLTKEERLKKQAEVMRAAKAKKRQERLAKEAAEKAAKELKKNKKVVTVNPNLAEKDPAAFLDKVMNETTNKPQVAKKANISDEELEILRGL